MKKVAIMCRVSSDEQAKGYSLDDQHEKITDYCKRNDYEIVYEIKEDHSAKSFDRPEWKKWMDLVKSKRVKVDEILFTSWDRFSRDLTGALTMINYLRDRGIVPQSVEQPIDYNIPENLFMLAIYLANPDVDNQRRSIKIRGGIRQGLKQGRWPRRPVYGFKSSKNEQGKSMLIHDPEKACNILEIFERVSEGDSQKEIRSEFSQRGILVSRNNMSKILRNVLYMGKVVVPANEKEPMQIVEGLHEPIVSEILFYSVQQLLSNNKKARGKFIPKYAKLRNDFHLRGIIDCDKCGHKMTSSLSRGKMGKRYGYYHCNHCKGQRLSAIKVHEAFERLLNSMSIGTELKTMYNSILEEYLGSSKQDNKKKIQNLQGQLEKINNRLETSQDLMLDGKLEPDEYVTIKARYIVQQNEMKQKIRGLRATNNEFATLAKSDLNLLSNICIAYKNSTIQLKQKILSSIFPENLSFDGKIFRTPRLNEIFNLFSSIDKSWEESKKGQLILINQLSPAVGNEGFEPPTPSV